MTTLIKEKSVWSGSNHRTFCVSKISNKNGQVWVHYTAVGNADREYSCLAAAFASKFTEYTNSN